MGDRGLNQQLGTCDDPDCYGSDGAGPLHTQTSVCGNWRPISEERTSAARATGAGGRGGAKMVAILFARADSVYKCMPDCDVYDAARDARTWPGGMSVVAHPPCRAWGRLRAFAAYVPGERELAIWAVEQVRK